MTKQQRLTGICTYADGVPFDGTLRINRTDGNALEVTKRDIQIVNGIIPDYVKLTPGIYEIQWLATNPSGFLPSESWVVPDANEVPLSEMRDRYLLKSVIQRKDTVIVTLQKEIKRLKGKLESKPIKETTPESAILSQIKAITGE
jgi:hypothetical protein